MFRQESVLLLYCAGKTENCQIEMIDVMGVIEC